MKYNIKVRLNGADLNTGKGKQVYEDSNEAFLKAKLILNELTNIGIEASVEVAAFDLE